MRRSVCVHRLGLGLYSHSKEFWWNGVRTNVNSREKSILPEEFSSREDLTHGAASSRTASPTHYQRVIPAPSRLIHSSDLKAVLKWLPSRTPVCQGSEPRLVGPVSACHDKARKQVWSATSIQYVSCLGSVTGT